MEEDIRREEEDPPRTRRCGGEGTGLPAEETPLGEGRKNRYPLREMDASGWEGDPANTPSERSSAIPGSNAPLLAPTDPHPSPPIRFLAEADPDPIRIEIG